MNIKRIIAVVALPVVLLTAGCFPPPPPPSLAASQQTVDQAVRKLSWPAHHYAPFTYVSNQQPPYPGRAYCEGNKYWVEIYGAAFVSGEGYFMYVIAHEAGHIRFCSWPAPLSERQQMVDLIEQQARVTPHRTKSWTVLEGFADCWAVFQGYDDPNHYWQCPKPVLNKVATVR